MAVWIVEGGGGGDEEGGRVSPYRCDVLRETCSSIIDTVLSKLMFYFSLSAYLVLAIE